MTKLYKIITDQYKRNAEPINYAISGIIFVAVFVLCELALLLLDHVGWAEVRETILSYRNSKDSLIKWLSNVAWLSWQFAIAITLSIRLGLWPGTRSVAGPKQNPA